MKVSIFAVGRMKSGPEKELADRYAERFARAGPALGLDFAGMAEIPESRRQSAAERCREEGAAALGQLADKKLILLDEGGRNLGSEALARMIGRWRDDGVREIQFAIGGPDGHDPELKRKAELVLSFGAATWPHQIVRMLLAEQLYRAATILSGHPYHRGGQG
ncbi:23S rRNA (pseudouridine(1915)-N(3))-methyltransferase RlmH [Chelativorans sp. ZYF759]|uniref:23S rRNA (pseudouridine(1915)-N(3))-methyltransferase RlmH n=1 Tax=Chelativorans sp. ZYF759 TaxID=2692213 RepID=UPI00145F7EC4|nr:23S rRNA (pseudouridine(1915)-N(3))-methyltransferase RlmH [Chelativorans sp. ZYF759]NMG38041.1 23S rRNA (pseudouridine(1915)-N(3))-methyltransferase RlmH [Chelativorans sp. ZYF759]